MVFLVGLFFCAMRQEKAPALHIASCVDAPQQFFAQYIGEYLLVALDDACGESGFPQRDAFARMFLFGAAVETDEEMPVTAFGHQGYLGVVVDDEGPYVETVRGNRVDDEI